MSGEKLDLFGNNYGTAMQEHTQTPWKSYGTHIRSSRETWVANCKSTITPMGPAEADEANAAFIVRACNAHEDLVAQLKAAVDLLENMIIDETQTSIAIAHVRQYEAAIARAEGK